tara:strand:+ start:275 stop:412 length:138 start_codon:yes stop_codon:yes gene_type:complete
MRSSLVAINYFKKSEIEVVISPAKAIRFSIFPVIDVRAEFIITVS